MPAENGSDLSQRIMRAAEQLFFANGYANTPLRTIANEAGTSESGVLRLYNSKNGLLRAVYADCWGQINDYVDAEMTAAAEIDSDPRNLLLAVMRAVLEVYQSDPKMMHFINSQFGSRDTAGLVPGDGVDPTVDLQVRKEYRRYLERIHDLAGAVAINQPALAKSGVSKAALGHIVTSIIYGIQASWWMAGQEQTVGVRGVTMDEALAGLRFFLYQTT
ncbi:MAG: TetR/AcrR family transcriptional regulator [Actinobacteria bacterium]|nr:TetR/AcrR family transcriptional regulator [Actinomycetota bacterium]